MIDVAVRHAQGWNLFTQEPEEFRRRVEMVRGVEAAQGRIQPLPKSVYLFVDRVHGDLHRVLADFEAVGAEEAMLVAMRPRGESILNLARQLLLGTGVKLRLPQLPAHPIPSPRLPKSTCELCQHLSVTFVCASIQEEPR